AAGNPILLRQVVLPDVDTESIRIRRIESGLHREVAGDFALNRRSPPLLARMLVVRSRVGAGQTGYRVGAKRSSSRLIEAVAVSPHRERVGNTQNTCIRVAELEGPAEIRAVGIGGRRAETGDARGIVRGIQRIEV